MKVEITEERLRSMDPGTGVHHNLQRGDQVVVSDACGEEWCRNGWAEDLSGVVKKVYRVVRDAVVEPHSARHAMVDSNRMRA